MEFVGSLPVLVLAALVCVQALLVALSLIFAQVTAQRSAHGMNETQARSVVPGVWRSRVSLHADTQRSRATVRTPALLPGAGKWLAVSATTERAS